MDVLSPQLRDKDQTGNRCFTRGESREEKKRKDRKQSKKERGAVLNSTDPLRPALLICHGEGWSRMLNQQPQTSQLIWGLG